MRLGARAPEVWALALSAAWLALAALGWLLLGPGAAAALAALLPLGLIWLGAGLMRLAARAEEDRARLQEEVGALRSELRRLARARAPEEPQAEPRPEPAPSDARPGAETRPETRPEADAEPQEDEEPPPLPRPPPLPAMDFIRALNFPEDADDREGFEALRRALADPQSRRLVQASQDVLTLLSQNGVYMDDLHAEPAPPALWRRVAGGVRGPAVAEVAGVDDEDALELARARMMRDTVFRDAVQHFLRQFDLGLQRFVSHATDEEIALFAETRTALAFMLLARVAKLFE